MRAKTCFLLNYQQQPDNDNVSVELCAFFKNIFLQNISKKNTKSCKNVICTFELRSYLMTTFPWSSVLFFRNIFLQNISKKSSTFRENVICTFESWCYPITTFSGDFELLFLNIFLQNIEISRSRSRISQFLFQPNACKNMFSFELPTAAGSRLFLHKVVQRSVMQCNFSFPPIASHTDKHQRTAQCGIASGNPP